MTSQAPAAPLSPVVAKGAAYLRQELTKSRNGDAIRALLEAGARGYEVGTALDETLNFLKAPAAWDQYKPPAGAVDPRLVRIQFASALAVAERHGKAASTDLAVAAKLLVADQSADGSWLPDQALGADTPESYGAVLATWSARTALIASGMQPDTFTIVQADRWLRGLTVETVADALAMLLALDLTGDVMAEGLRRTALSLVRAAQRPSGGWSADAESAPQIFETALAVLALCALNVEPRTARSTYRPEELLAAIAKGKAFIESQQRPDGSWPESSGKAADLQRMSITGWALLALLAG